MHKIANPKPPKFTQGRLSWQTSKLFLPRLAWLGMIRGWITVWDSFGTPGDTISTASVCREIKRRHPRIKINCLTPNPDLLVLDPAIDRLNGPVGLVLLRFWYPDVIKNKDPLTNILAPALRQAGIQNFQYQARFFLSTDEKIAVKPLLAAATKPLITLNVQSRELVKMWPTELWSHVVAELSKSCSIAHLGTDEEPEFPGVIRLAGKLSMRESAAVMSHAKLHLGSVSFLMHVANGLDVPSVIVYGGREKPANSGYAANINLSSSPECSPCWIHTSHGEKCPYDVKCMREITPSNVLEASFKLLRQST